MGAVSRRWLAWGLLWVIVCGCTAPADDDTAEHAAPAPAPSAVASEPVSTVAGGTVAVAVLEEPTTLNPWSAAPDDAAGAIVRPMLAPLWRVRPDGTLEPWLLADAPTVRGGSDGEPFTVAYRIRRDAVWSDGHTIDGADLLFTLELCARLAVHDDCTAVDLERSAASGKEAVIAFDRPMAAWGAIMSSMPVLPEHVLRDRDPATTWTRRVSVSSGPFRFESWVPGDRLVLVRNERWWGEPAVLDRVEFRFRAEPGVGAVAAVADGTVDVAQVSASPAATDRARADARVRTEVAAGASWAALDFNVETPLLQRRELRRALAAAIDRATIVEELIAPVSSGATVVRQLPGGPRAADVQTLSYPAHDPAAAARQLDAADCAQGEDGIRVCDGQPMVFDLVVTADDWQQPIVAEYVQTQLADIGVAVTIADAAAGGQQAETEGESSHAGGQGSEEPVDGDDIASWDLRIAAVPVRADPQFAGRRWRCEHPANTQSFCAPRYDTLVEQAAGTVDGQRRAELEGEAAALLSQEVPTFPLYEMPIMVVRSATVRGPTLNATAWGPTWNIEQWARTANDDV